MVLMVSTKLEEKAVANIMLKGIVALIVNSIFFGLRNCNGNLFVAFIS